MAHRRNPRLDWFTLNDGLYHPIEPDADGLLVSGVFDGLRLDREALLRGEMARVLGTFTADK